MSTEAPLEAALTRERIVLLSVAASVAALAWAWLGSAHSLGSTAHAVLPPAAHPFAGGRFVLAFLMWLAMMIAMMLPSVLPWISTFAAVSRDFGRTGRAYTGASLFGAGYLSVWAAFSLAGAWLQLTLQQRALLHPEALELAPTLGGALLMLAGVFQLTPLKAACLRHCRSPFGFFLSRWQNGPVGAFEMGRRHGLYCVGCCWALMLLGFALGVMNLIWMAVATLIICGEKMLPGGEAASRIFGGAFLVWGLWLLAAPAVHLCSLAEWLRL